MDDQKTWYYEEGGHSVGPFHPETMKRMAEAGIITGSTQVIEVGNVIWSTLAASNLSHLVDGSPARVIKDLEGHPSRGGSPISSDILVRDIFVISILFFLAWEIGTALAFLLLIVLLGVVACAVALLLSSYTFRSRILLVLGVSLVSLLSLLHPGYGAANVAASLLVTLSGIGLWKLIPRLPPSVLAPVQTARKAFDLSAKALQGFFRKISQKIGVPEPMVGLMFGPLTYVSLLAVLSVVSAFHQEPTQAPAYALQNDDVDEQDPLYQGIRHALQSGSMRSNGFESSSEPYQQNQFPIQMKKSVEPTLEFRKAYDDSERKRREKLEIEALQAEVQSLHAQRMADWAGFKSNQILQAKEALLREKQQRHMGLQ